MLEIINLNLCYVRLLIADEEEKILKSPENEEDLDPLQQYIREGLRIINLQGGERL
jgi:hypothetical protein